MTLSPIHPWTMLSLVKLVSCGFVPVIYLECNIVINSRFVLFFFFFNLFWLTGLCGTCH